MHNPDRGARQPAGPAAAASRLAPPRVAPPRVAPPRMAMVSSTFYRTDTRIQRQAEALVARGYSVDVICQREPGDPDIELVRGVRVRRVGPPKYRGASVARYTLGYSGFFVSAFDTVTRLHRRYGLDVVHVYSMPEALLFTAVVPRIAGVPLVYDAGDLTTELYPAKFGSRGGPLVPAALRLQERLCLSMADLIVTVHEEYRRRLLERGVPDSKIRIVMNVPDEALFTEELRHIPREFPDRPDTFTIVHHGSLLDRYGADVLLEAMHLLRHRVPGLHLRIYGDGDLRPRLLELIDRYHLDSRVEMSEGYLKAHLIPPLLAAGDISVVPTRSDPFTETILPNKLMETLTLGLPTIVSNTRTVAAHVPPDVVDYVRPGDAAELADAIERLWADGAHRRDLHQRALAFSDAHRWAEQAERYCRAIDDLVRPDRRAALAAAGH